MNEQDRMPIQLEDLYLIIGEREVIRFLQQKQIMEMSKEIERLRQELNGKLGQSEDYDPIRHIPRGVQGARSGFVPDVSGLTNQSPSGDNPSGPFPGEIAGMGRSKLD